MTTPASEQRGNALFLQGSFNPQILQPAWLAAQNLIRDSESENAKIRIVHSEIVAFGLDWADVEIERDKLTIQATPKSESPEQVRDLALGIIEILDHTPIEHVGISFFAHYALADQATRDKLGWTLVPPAPFSKQIERPGMRTLKIAGRRPGEEEGPGGLLVTIEPSAQIMPNGVFINVLDQYNILDHQPNLGTGPAVECVKSNWDASSKRAEAISAEIFSVI